MMYGFVISGLQFSNWMRFGLISEIRIVAQAEEVGRGRRLSLPLISRFLNASRIGRAVEQ